ncbi:MAG: hypothetical protein AB1468_00690 [Candidatus Micrarchaeota archaeon]
MPVDKSLMSPAGQARIKIAPGPKVKLANLEWIIKERIPALVWLNKYDNRGKLVDESARREIEKEIGLIICKRWDTKKTDAANVRALGPLFKKMNEVLVAAVRKNNCSLAEIKSALHEAEGHTSFGNTKVERIGAPLVSEEEAIQAAKEITEMHAGVVKKINGEIMPPHVIILDILRLMNEISERDYERNYTPQEIQGLIVIAKKIMKTIKQGINSISYYPQADNIREFLAKGNCSSETRKKLEDALGLAEYLNGVLGKCKEFLEKME